MSYVVPQVAFGGGEISPNSYARIDLNKFGTSVAEMRNFYTLPEGGAVNRPGTDFVIPTLDETKKSRLIPFEFNEEQAYALEFGDKTMRVIIDGGVALEDALSVTDATQTNPVTITVAGHGYSDGDMVYISGVVGMTELNGKFYTVSGVATDTFQLSGVDGTGYAAYVSGGNSGRVYVLSTPYSSVDLPKLKYRQSNDVIYIAHRDYEPRKLTRTGGTSWTLDVIDFIPEQAAPTNVVVTPNATGTETFTYQVTAVNEETAEESLVVEASTTTSKDAEWDNTISWTAAEGAGSYNVYRSDNGLFGYIGSTEEVSFTDDNIAPDLNDTAPKLKQPFNEVNTYPGCVGLHEQRSVWGNSNNKPLNVWLSQTGQFENMNTSSPTKATDAISIRLVTGQGNEIRHFRSFEDRLFIFTSGTIWTLRPGGDADAITPASKQLSTQEFLSCSDLPPIAIKAAILMVAGKDTYGFEVHQLSESLTSATAGRYTGSDLTVLSRHLFEGHTIKDWAYSERPHHLILAVRDDGKLLCMTYLHEHQIYAWSMFEMGGEVESVVSIPEGQEDAVYIIIKRNINGVDRRYIERFHSRLFSTIYDAHFVDCGLRYVSPEQNITGATQTNPVVITCVGHGYNNGDHVRFTAVSGMTELNVEDNYTIGNVTPDTFELVNTDGTGFGAYASGGVVRRVVNSVSGLEHIEGEDFVALADGSIETGTITDGVASFQNYVSVASVGLGYEGHVTSLPTNINAQTLAHNKKIGNVFLRVKDTRGVFAGPDSDNLEEYPSRSSELWGDPAGMLSDVLKIPVVGDYERDPQIRIQSEAGLPITILSMMPDVENGSK